MSPVVSRGLGVASVGGGVVTVTYDAPLTVEVDDGRLDLEVDAQPLTLTFEKVDNLEAL
jgi:hypothetical protein